MYKKILVPLDGSEFAENALQHARTISIGCAVEKVILLRVVAPIIKDVKDMIEAEYVRKAERKREADAQEYLNTTAESLKKDGLPVETELIVNGEPADKILEYAREKKVDLIVMSTHGRTGFQKWVFGSVANNVLVNSLIPVLMVVPAGRRGMK
jgi:nucleotide-binding universal stress UspA family protein